MLVTITNCAPLVTPIGCEAKLSAVGLKLTLELPEVAVGADVATPFKSTNCGLPVAELSRKSRVVDRLPVTFDAGLKRTTTVQEVCGGIGAAGPQLFGPITKSFRSPPLNSGGVVSCRSAPPVLVSVIV